MYEINIIGRCNKDTDIPLWVNGRMGNDYYQSGVFYDGTGTSSLGTLSGHTGWRPASCGFYYAHNLRNQLTFIRGYLCLGYNESNQIATHYSWQAMCSWHGTQLWSQCSGAINNTGNVTAIKISVSDSGGYFIKGTRFIIRKMNGVGRPI